jgi:hypothetical protein
MVGVMQHTDDADEFIAADGFPYRAGAGGRNESLIQIMTSIRTLLQVWIGRVVRTVHDLEATSAGASRCSRHRTAQPRRLGLP